MFPKDAYNQSASLGATFSALGRNEAEPTCSAKFSVRMPVRGIIADYRTPCIFTALAVVPFPGEQGAMPTQNGGGRNYGFDFLKGLPTQYFSFDGQATPLVIVKQNPFLAELMLERLVLY
jgi:hypothetical protein